ncbi:MAG: hypothetical protein A3C70_02390 [Candidatus Zambryskibacteria bacterium RIFCSPHIGHO2_02_FULL_43_14]|uniref:DNA polymerase III delta subunit-like C-terminal domain-containing protein n=1 Tax=Candidatus Zambryskibacteria bacterium RIFCSPHIGHO2_02_FULL_43_14 TaxID=1802748 RepID=A0A1G2TI83_9BACT|nr:MAG: hypothetical protein A2829_00080 [Candidatus Zambryskibacteria bacterium RIFCSPHIGHO2_01_FULL_43_60]OHA97005.1 MAG: hypothetical protein A3C70_02390 [Candidatus Zambryskibacteria bacterium RIFCSPHIGHO2_02_FULL_43_14]OHB03730.1 MAG: hypothetical protein A3B03_01945 [Candidatus Zambryskibacteria bacterium RIFCSPLOWO2_01_FULL_42_41]
MNEEYYHKDIFGTVVDVNLGAVEKEEERPLFDKKGREFNIFALTDALGERKKKETWILYQKALSAGLSAEEIFFKIVWQVKSMLIAARTKNVEETDMKPFPYSKAKSFLKNFKLEELEKFSENLVIGYHQARRGEREIETLVEKILLKL